MSKLLFIKFEGAGNDFVLIDDREERFPTRDRAWIQKLCHRKFGIGADGVILVQNSTSFDVQMRIFNSDGGEAESCGNGLRCFLLFLVELGFPRREYRIAIGKREVRARFEGDRVAVDMGVPEALCLHLETEVGVVHAVDTGVPHVVHFVANVETVDLPTVGLFLRNHPLFAPRGVNVNAVSLKGGIFRARTFERGVEGETLACGTGAVAIAAVAQKLYGAKESYTIRFKGGELAVYEREGHFWMVGPARRVFEGSFS